MRKLSPRRGSTFWTSTARFRPTRGRTIFLWLDELEFEPDYEYVTGFYIKNNEGFLGTFYIDQVSLLVLPEAETQ